MKKTLTAILFLLIACLSANAAPAWPYPVVVTQPDGSKMTIRLHGDEYYHWVTCDGVVVERNQKGYWRKLRSADLRSAAPEAARVEQARAMRREGAARFAQANLPSGRNHFLVVLVEFSDLPFTVPNPQHAFSELLNKDGYSENGGTGSVHDYYYENSMGVFDPVFDVYGPVKISGTMASYGRNNSNGNDTNPRGLMEACDSLYKWGVVNFSDYDNDKNGFVDNVFFYYAGHNEAEGGGEDTIWPHASTLTGDNQRRYGDVRLVSYNCSSEYRGSEGNTMAGIGTFCHEFAHRLGLPDFYDTDYAENGYGDGLYNFSLMSSGNYNNNGRTPPYLTAVERSMLGWMEDPQELKESGNYTLTGIHRNVAYSSPTDNDGENFVYEVRTSEGWDRYIWNSWGVDTADAGGMLIYHVDRSQNMVEGMEAKRRWDAWDGINAYSVHPCIYIKTPDEKSAVWPGANGANSFTDISSPSARSWDGEATCFNLYDIAYSGGVASFRLDIDRSRAVLGYIRDSAGNPLAGVELSLADESSVQAKRVLRTNGLRSDIQIRRAASSVVRTDDAGYFYIPIPESAGNNFTLSASKPGYKTWTTSFPLSTGKARKDIILKRIDESSSAGLQKYIEVSGYGIGFGVNPADVSVAVHFSADELKDYVGMKLSKVEFLFYSTSAEAVDAFVDFGEERYYTQRVSDPHFTGNGPVSFSEANMENAGVVIPSGRDMYVGYALKAAADDREGRTACYPVAIDTLGVDGGGFIKREFATTGGNWSRLGYTDDDQVVYCNAIIRCTVEDNVSPFYKYGVLTILNPKADTGYAVGDSFALSLSEIGITPESVEWTFDGTLCENSPVALTSSGRHTVRAIVTLPSGQKQTITQVISVQ